MPSKKTNLLIAAEWMWSNRGKNLWWGPNVLTEINKDPSAPHLTIVEARSIFTILEKRELIFPTIEKGYPVYHLHEAKEKEWAAFIAELNAETQIMLKQDDEAFFTFYADSPVLEELETYFQKEGLTAVTQYIIRASESPITNEEQVGAPKDGQIVVISHLSVIGKILFKFFCLQVKGQCSLSVQHGVKPATIEDSASLEGIEKFLAENDGEKFAIGLKDYPPNQDMKTPNEHPSTATTVDAIEAEFPKHCEAFRQDVSRATLELFGKGLGRSSAANDRVTRVSIAHLQKGAAFIFETIEQHVDWDLAADKMSDHLKEIFSLYFDRFSRHVVEIQEGWFVKYSSKKSPIHALQVTREAERLVKANYPKIETLTKKSMSKKPSGEGKPSISIGTNYGPLQIGDNNSQQINSSIQMIESAIDASPATAQEKAEAKSLLQKIMTNPLLASAIGGVVSGVTRAALGG